VPINTNGSSTCAAVGAAVPSNVPAEEEALLAVTKLDELDDWDEASGARHVIEALPETTYELIEDCGHCPQLEATGALLELLLEFPG